MVQTYLSLHVFVLKSTSTLSYSKHTNKIKGIRIEQVSVLRSKTNISYGLNNLKFVPSLSLLDAFRDYRLQLNLSSIADVKMYNAYKNVHFNRCPLINKINRIVCYRAVRRYADVFYWS